MKTEQNAILQYHTFFSSVTFSKNWSHEEKKRKFLRNSRFFRKIHSNEICPIRFTLAHGITDCFKKTKNKCPFRCCPSTYKIVHLIFLRVLFSFLPVLLPSLSIFRARISRIRSKNTLSTFSRVLAEVSTYGTFQSSA